MAAKRGRPSRYTDQIADDICSWISSGRTLRDYCRQEGAPGWRTVYDWLDTHAKFSARFARAREIGHSAIAQECLDIADDGSEQDVRHRKLRIWTRLQLLAKWDPKRYGDRQRVEHAGGVSISVVTGVPRS